MPSTRTSISYAALRIYAPAMVDVSAKKMGILRMFWLRSSLLLLTAIGIFLLISLLFVLPRYLDQQTKQRAESFCRSVQLDESLHSFISKCNAAQGACASWSPVDGITRHQAWFSGIILNAYVCEASSKNGKIISKFFEEHTN
jgi:hypothetical protein